jgi:HSP20 family protein
MKDQPLTRLRNEFEDLIDRFFHRRAGALERRMGFENFGELELEDRPDEVVVRAEVPGFEPEELEVNVSGQLLTVKAEKQEPKRGKKARRDGGAEWSYRSFFSSIVLPQEIDADRIEARYRNGMLELRAPKTEAAKSKRISVQR